MLPRWLIGFRALALASAFAAAFVPLATYITDDKRDWLWIHIGVNIAAYIAVALTTIYTTISLTQQDINKYHIPAYWANNFVMQTWYLGVSKTWGWHAAAGVGRLGLALAMMQHLDTVCGLGCENYSIFRFHVYSGISKTYPQWEMWFIALIVLVIFSLLETSLLTTFTLCSLSFLRSNKLASAITFGVRLLIVFTIVQTMYFVDKSSHERLNTEQDSWSSMQILQITLEEWYHIGFTWLDGGTMMAAKILRPLKSYPCASYDDQHVCITYSTQPHMIIAVVQTIAAYASYALASLILLSLTHYLHWRREQGMIRHALTDTSKT